MSSLVAMVFTLYSFVIIARFMLSWIRLDSYNPVVQFIIRVTEPVLLPMRKLIPPAGNIDFSSIVTFLLLRTVGSILTFYLRRLGL